MRKAEAAACLKKLEMVFYFVMETTSSSSEVAEFESMAADGRALNVDETDGRVCVEEGGDAADSPNESTGLTEL